MQIIVEDGKGRPDANSFVPLEKLTFYRDYYGFRIPEAEAARAAVRGENDSVVLAGPDEAHRALALVELAGPWAQIALDATVVERMPVLGRDNRGGNRHSL